MEYMIENEVLRLTASDVGGELRDLRRSGDPDQPLLWDGKPDIWPRRAPVCFPWCGKVEEGWFEDGGIRYEAPQHGFVRDMEHTLIQRTADSLTFRLEWPGDGNRWPWRFSFETRHALVGNTVETTCTAVNLDGRSMPVQLGFHTGLRCPFTAGRLLRDYVVRFDQPEAPGGGDRFLLDPHTFDDDSICLPGLRSAWLQVEEAGGNYLRVETEGYPYVLLWSTPGEPGFLCIEPWTGYTGPGHDLSARPGAALLRPGETFARTQRLTVGIHTHLL